MIKLIFFGKYLQLLTHLSSYYKFLIHLQLIHTQKLYNYFTEY